MDSWFKQFNSSPKYQKLKENPIAYFCAEYALTNNLPLYAGGLGVLAGDYLREANEQSIPLIAIGLYYNDGYQTLHKVDQRGFIEGPHVHTPPEEFGLTKLLDKDGNLIIVDVPVQDRNIQVKAWVWHVGNIPVYLLSTDVEQNSENDRKITDHLYVVDRETRLQQNIVLGIGGVRILEKLGIKPSIYHMNEGYSSLLCFEVIRKIMQEKKIGFVDAKKKVGDKIVFSNHTLVTQGHDTYSNELLALNLSKYISELGVAPNDVFSQGNAQDSNSFSTSLLPLRLAEKTNAVSKIHAKKALDIWPHHPMIPITNGINIPFWNSILNEADIWQSHLENKRELLGKIRLLSNEAWDEKALLIGWARRLVPYKRPNALFEDVPRLKKILVNAEKPVRIVISGSLHPSDADAEDFFNKLRQILDTEFKGYVTFLPGYDLSLAKLITSGCDVWFNTPIVGFEACGTSGMKAALNGNLPVSTKDGWMDEIDFYGVGWSLDSERINESILNTLEQNIIPLYFQRDQNGAPIEWIKNMINARNLIKNNYSTTRMAREYIEQLYLPLIK